jgi:branched-chain amino acid transport system permease protein
MLGLTAAAKVKHGHADGDAVGDLLEDDAAGGVGDVGVDLDAAVDGTWVHDDGFGLHPAGAGVLLTRTKIGKAMRAMADSPELAQLTGIETEKVIRATWIVGASLAAAAGVFLAIDTHVETMMGFKILLPLFASAILGGVGSPYGAMAGGLVIGIAEEISTYPWLGDGPLISPGYKAGVAFALMVAMLIWRPSGLFRGRVF